MVATHVTYQGTTQLIHCHDVHSRIVVSLLYNAHALWSIRYWITRKNLIARWFIANYCFIH